MSSTTIPTSRQSLAKSNDETTPLLGSLIPAAEPVETAPEPYGVTETSCEDDDMPLPIDQIFLLCYTRLVEPIAFFSIFPFINEMIYKTGGIPKSDVGFYSGMIESLFSLTQMCVMVFWGQAADYFGRKPVLVFSLCGVTVATALFGMSKSLWQMILFRCLAGVFAGTIVTVRAMITENSTKKTQARAFSYFAFVGNLGIFAGPFIGGALESPAAKFPSTFGKMHFFREYPYALPGFVCAGIGASAAVVSAWFIKETLHLHHSKKNPNEAPMSTWELLKYPGIASVMLIYENVLLLAFAYTAVVPVFLFEPVELGGIGFSPFFISLTMGVGGLAQAVWILFAFPPLQLRIGTGGVLRLCAIAWPIFFAAWPLGNLLLRHNMKVAFWIVTPFEVIMGSGVAMAYTSIQLAVNDIAPSHQTLGTLNSIVLALSSGLRAFVPAVSTSIYAAGVKHQILGGEFAWPLLIAFALLLNVSLRFLPEKAEGRTKATPDIEA
ncbi:MFS general substrate transporter [Delitschia confertaspora ATCC 74209]|uniref:MFS general substrate transporter n=1 Tax=Delitschia confertaspora ATCC 74209 TaxID=1513339 RepID=A0A9P4JRE7_9PLEO|nr:MFS general substrate transporter [Delitschia confertaspora ATCC 74209]